MLTKAFGLLFSTSQLFNNILTNRFSIKYPYSIIKRFTAKPSYGIIPLFSSTTLLLAYYYKSRHKTGAIPFSVLTLAAHCNDDSQGSNDLRARMNFLADVCEKVFPGVVCISGSRNISHSSKSISTASGFIVHEDGLILTNAHVVNGMKVVRVKLHNNVELNGHILGLDESLDLALIKVNSPQKLPALELASSNDLRAGEMVLAMGSPLSLDNTVTSGIISQTSRGGRELGLPTRINYIQTDANITTGNSGGPLVNLNGKVIGINTMTAGPGLSFSIPSDYAKHFIKTITENSPNKHNCTNPKYYLGIQMFTLTPQIIAYLRDHHLINIDKLESSSGVFVALVKPDSPAEHGGLEVRDILININGVKVTSTSDVLRLLAAGGELRACVLRNNTLMDLLIIPSQS